MTSLRKARRRALTLPLLQESMTSPDEPINRSWRLLSKLPVLGAKTKPRQNTIQITFDQLQSPLFRLPFELRDMIWKEVLGGGIMHITHVKNGLGHTRCTDEKGEKWFTSRHDCWGIGCCLSARRGYPSLYVGPIYGVEKPQSRLGLVMSCRALYGVLLSCLNSGN
jgi:hypothetical protein